MDFYAAGKCHHATGILGLSSPGMQGVPWHLRIWADQLTLSQPGGTDYAHHITTGTPGFSDLPTALYTNIKMPYLIMPQKLQVTSFLKENSRFTFSFVTKVD